MLEIKDNVFVNLLRPSLIEFAKELEKQVIWKKFISR